MAVQSSEGNNFWDQFPIVDEQNKENFWDQYPEVGEESFSKNTARKGIQAAKGLMRSTAPGLAYDAATQAMDIIGTGEALSELEELEERAPYLHKYFGDLGFPEKIDREKYLQSVNEATSFIPTVENLSRIGEEATGLPLEAKTAADRLFELSGFTGGLTPGNLLSKSLGAAVAPVTSATAQALGVSEPLANIIGMGSSVPLSTVGRAESIKKPSGLTTRRFEKTNKRTSVTPRQYQRINESVENEFRDLSDKVLSEKSKVYKDMKTNPSFEAQLDEGFDRVQELAKQIPEQMSPFDIKKNLYEDLRKSTKKGISPNESEITYRKQLEKTIKNIPDNRFQSVEDYLEQYRKNNRELRQYYEPGKSSAYNEGKKEALLSYNRAIADEFKNKFPDSQFVKLFEETNALNRASKDVERVNEFVDNITKEKIGFKEAKKFFNDKYLRQSFERTLGKEGFNEYESLMKDLMTLENPMSLLKKAEAENFFELLKLGGVYLAKPGAGWALGVKQGYSAAQKALLHHPEIAIPWRRSISELKKGNYAAATQVLKIVDQEVKKSLKEFGEEREEDKRSLSDER